MTRKCGTKLWLEIAGLENVRRYHGGIISRSGKWWKKSPQVNLMELETESIGQNQKDRLVGIEKVVEYVMVELDRPENTQNHGKD